MIGVSVLLLLGIALRVGLFMDAISSEAILTKYTQSEALQSILYNHRYTLSAVKEAIFVTGNLNDGNNPYPLVTFAVDKFLEKYPHQFSQDFVFGILSLLLDALIAYKLYRLAKALNKGNTDHMNWEKRIENDMNPLIYPISASKAHLFGLRFDDDDQKFPTLFASSNVPHLCAMIYFFNPFTILTSASGVPSIQGLWIFLLVCTLVDSVNGNALSAALFLSILCHVDIYNIVLLMPCAILWKHHYEFKSNELKKKRPSPFFFIFCFLFWFVTINVASMIFFGWGLKTLKEAYDVTKNYKDLTPNLGMHWYLFINTFSRYREYFVIVCSGFVFLFCIPLLIRFYNYPMEMVIMIQLLRVIFNPRPTLQEVTFALSLVTLARRSIARMSVNSVIWLLALPVPIILYVLDHGLWLEIGSGNANYMFFQCLVYNVFLGFFTFDFISSTLRRDKALQLTHKNSQMNSSGVDKDKSD
mmetsp:Transcript_12783/g.23985  ORF Transcript_12783/g.23985 Transcript_12783/m.23985 type:complete len:472 (-) Transcript_12783:1443-2858(-)